VKKPAHISQPRTTERVVELLEERDLSGARVADVGAGNGHFAYVLGERLHARGLDVAQHLFPCDTAPEEFEYERVECRRVGSDGRLPFEDESLDAVVSIEVIEHVEDQFAFLRELARVTRPGGRVIVTTPNVLNLHSRVRTLLTGFPELFDPLPLDGSDARYLGGHIHPISPYFLAFDAHRAGLRSPTFHFDRIKRSAAAWTILLAPLLLGGVLFQRLRMKRKRPEVLAQNAEVLPPLHCWGLLTGRTTILSVAKPDGATA
jgi:SAM-dependent methyltransferase